MNSFALDQYGISAETRTAPGVIVRKPGTEELRQRNLQFALR